jgi:heat shock protein HtpX
MTMLRASTSGLDERARRAASARNAVHSATLVLGIGLITGLCAYILWDGRGVLGTFACVLILLFVGPRIAPDVVMRMFKARPLPPGRNEDLFEIVAELARRAGLPATPRIYIIPSHTLNAFAVGRPDASSLAVTEGMLDALNNAELAGVFAHEISHVRNNDLWIMGLADIMSRLTQFMAYLAVVLAVLNLPLAIMGQEHAPWIVVILLYSAPVMSSLMQLALSRTREYDADVEGARLTGDPRALASALAKLERQQGQFWEHVLPSGGSRGGNGGGQPSVLRSHPGTKERIRRLLELEDHIHLGPHEPYDARRYWPWASYPARHPWLRSGTARRRPRLWSRFWS